MLENEKQLIKAAQEGNSEIFGNLYTHYLPKIYRYILIKVNNKQMTEDLVHEVFVRAWTNLKRYQHQGFPFSSWLYRIARNQVIDHYRIKRDHLSLDDTDDEFLEVENNLAAELDTRFKWEEVLNAMRNLTPDQQDVLIMRFVEEMSHQEIAFAMKKSEGAVRLIQHRGINQLKIKFEDDKQQEQNA
jgi:RNA polymerase sigma-70 factor, ECF subfamily